MVDMNSPILESGKYEEIFQTLVNVFILDLLTSMGTRLPTVFCKDNYEWPVTADSF